MSVFLALIQVLQVNEYSGTMNNYRLDVPINKAIVKLHQEYESKNQKIEVKDIKILPYNPGFSYVYNNPKVLIIYEISEQ